MDRELVVVIRLLNRALTETNVLALKLGILLDRYNTRQHVPPKGGPYVCPICHTDTPCVSLLRTVERRKRSEASLRRLGAS